MDTNPNADNEPSIIEIEEDGNNNKRKVNKISNEKQKMDLLTIYGAALDNHQRYRKIINTLQTTTLVKAKDKDNRKRSHSQSRPVGNSDLKQKTKKHPSPKKKLAQKVQQPSSSQKLPQETQTSGQKLTQETQASSSQKLTQETQPPQLPPDLKSNQVKSIPGPKINKVQSPSNPESEVPERFRQDPKLGGKVHVRLEKITKNINGEPFDLFEEGLSIDEENDIKEAIKRSEIELAKENRIEAEAASLPHPPSGVALTESMIRLVESKLGQPGDTKIITKFTLTIKQAHLKLYKKRQWLEDPNIDFYLEMIKERNEQQRSIGADLPRIMIFHSFFFKFCHRNDFDAVKDTATENIFQFDLAFFPIHIRDHWNLIVADFKKKTLYCYDSMYKLNDKFLKIISKYLEREYKAKVESQFVNTQPGLAPTVDVDIDMCAPLLSPESGISNSSIDTLPVPSPLSPPSSGDDEQGNPEEENNNDISAANTSLPVLEVEIPVLFPYSSFQTWEEYFKDWVVDTIDPCLSSLPQQKNGSDCGIFLCQFAESLARGLEPPFDFTQKNMLYFRYLMAFETIHGKLVDRF